MTPRELEREVAEDFDAFYADWVVPHYGKWAPWWAWMQVPKTFVALLYNALCNYRSKQAK